MKTNKKKSSTMRKLLPAVAMLAVSAVSLSSATYAWFTMNKSVEVTGMKLKAQAEKGLLINEMTGTGTVSGTDNGSYSESATAGQETAISLRPASTSDLTNWWHANSKNSSNEAGAGTNGVDTDNTVLISAGKYYDNISPDNLSKAETTAIADTNAARTVYYGDGLGATESTLDDGEGYYIKYVYYLKSSSNTAMSVTADKLTATVTAALPENGTAQPLDPALRVGVKIDSTVKIFAPVSGADTSNKITNNDAGSAYTEVTPATATAALGANTTTFTIPAVNSATGLEVDVFVWFEGEDTSCKSDNITAADLNSYDIKVVFTDTEL